MADTIRRILYHTLVLTIIATVWAMGHAKVLAEQAWGRKSWPPLNPELFQFDEQPAADDADAHAQACSDDL